MGRSSCVDFELRAPVTVSLAFVFVFVLAFGVHSVNGMPNVERRALIDLFNKTGGRNWTANCNWLSLADVCSWCGVVCLMDTVIELQLHSNRLVGNLEGVDLTALENIRWCGVRNLRSIFNLAMGVGRKEGA